MSGGKTGHDVALQHQLRARGYACRMAGITCVQGMGSLQRLATFQETGSAGGTMIDAFNPSQKDIVVNATTLTWCLHQGAHVRRRAGHARLSAGDAVTQFKAQLLSAAD
jgi:hypothetical protein